MAPILDLALGTSREASTGTMSVTGHGLSLHNLGASFFAWFGIQSVRDRFQAIVILCVAYVAAGFIKGWLDFGNYLLALWIRVRATAALQTDLFRHLFGLSMGFFTRQRTGELMSRFATDTNAATSGPVRPSSSRYRRHRAGGPGAAHASTRCCAGLAGCRRPCSSRSTGSCS